MSDAEHQESNGNAAESNGDVPEIELIIKENNDDCNGDKSLKYENLLDVGEYRLHLQIVEPNERIVNRNTNCCTDDSAYIPIKSELSDLTMQPPINPVYTIAKENDFQEDKSYEVCTKDVTGIYENSAKQRNRTMHDSHSMECAIEAVVDEGLSVGQAARKYNLVKSTLWSRVRKHPKYLFRKPNNELSDLIFENLSSGVSLSETSRILKVAKSTVHQHKQRLVKEGRLNLSEVRLNPKLDSNMHICDNINERLAQAYRGHRVNGMSVRFAAQFYSVPLTTFWRFIRREVETPNSTASNGDDNTKLDKN